MQTAMQILSALTFYLDSDVDGFGDPGSTQNACSAPDGYVSNSDDCDDSDAGVNPNTTGLPIQMVTRSVTSFSPPAARQVSDGSVTSIAMTNNQPFTQEPPNVVTAHLMIAIV